MTFHECTVLASGEVYRYQTYDTTLLHQESVRLFKSILGEHQVLPINFRVPVFEYLLMRMASEDGRDAYVKANMFGGKIRAASSALVRTDRDVMKLMTNAAGVIPVVTERPVIVTLLSSPLLLHEDHKVLVADMMTCLAASWFDDVGPIC